MTHRLALAVVVLSIGGLADATPQITETVVFGDRTYSIRELPMVGLWDDGGADADTKKQPRPAFRVRSTANWKGYQSTFEIRDEKLFLRELEGWVEGGKKTNEEIIPGKRFPIVATWFTGRIHLDVGGNDRATQEAVAVIIFHIAEGKVVSMEFAERMKPVWTWNGMPPRRDE